MNWQWKWSWICPFLGHALTPDIVFSFRLFIWKGFSERFSATKRSSRNPKISFPCSFSDCLMKHILRCFETDHIWARWAHGVERWTAGHMSSFFTGVETDGRMFSSSYGCPWTVFDMEELAQKHVMWKVENTGSDSVFHDHNHDGTGVRLQLPLS